MKSSYAGTEWNEAEFARRMARAREQVETYREQEKAATQERTLNEAKATAAAQTAPCTVPSGPRSGTARISSMRVSQSPN